MRKVPPLGSNYEWSISSDQYYAPRGLTREEHEELAILSVSADDKLMKLEKQLGHKVIIAVSVGKFNMHLRVYNRQEVETRPDQLASRLAYEDESIYLHFGDNGEVLLVDGDWRKRAQGHSPELYGVRCFAPFYQRIIDNFHVQITNRPIPWIGLPEAVKPLEVVEEVIFSEPPTLEPAIEVEQ